MLNWLHVCVYMVRKELQFTGIARQRISCGVGSFLRAVVNSYVISNASVDWEYRTIPSFQFYLLVMSSLVDITEK